MSQYIYIYVYIFENIIKHILLNVGKILRRGKDNLCLKPQVKFVIVIIS